MDSILDDSIRDDYMDSILDDYMDSIRDDSIQDCDSDDDSIQDYEHDPGNIHGHDLDYDPILDCDSNDDSIQDYEHDPSTIHGHDLEHIQIYSKPTTRFKTSTAIHKHYKDDDRSRRCHFDPEDHGRLELDAFAQHSVITNTNESPQKAVNVVSRVARSRLGEKKTPKNGV
eukprot:GEMP01033484.1.p3 GENE.GEMP01033484.1~~GEMP01033484.1.p3  ORF type:complete len:171 (+),score=39.23 GEMP01033484.1:1005-1517(+)